MKFHSQDKNCRNPYRECNRLWSIRLGEEESLEIRVKLRRGKNQKMKRLGARCTDGTLVALNFRPERDEKVVLSSCLGAGTPSVALDMQGST
jgi:hypothetical protein